MSAVTGAGMLDGLTRADLAERARSGSDRRVVVEPTRRGRREVGACQAVWQRRRREALEGFVDENCEPRPADSLLRWR